MELSLPTEVFNALKESVESEKGVSLDPLAKSEETERANEKNIIKTPKIKTALSSDEKKRYSLIGEEFFKPFFKKLQRLRERELMLIKDDADTIDKGLEEQYKKEDDSDKSVKNSLWGYLILAAGAFILFKDEIIEFFVNLKKTFEKKIGDAIDKISFSNFPDISKAVDGLTTFWGDTEKWIQEVGNTITNSFKGGWDEMWKKFDFDGFSKSLSDALKGIPEAIVNALRAAADALASVFNLEEVSETEFEEAPEEALPNIQQESTEALQRAAMSFLNAQEDPISNYKIQAAYANYEDQIRGTVNDLGVSIENGRINQEEAQKAYLEKITSIIETEMLPDTAGINRREDLRTAVEKHFKNASYQNPIPIEELKEKLDEIASDIDLRKIDGEFNFDKDGTIQTLANESLKYAALTAYDDQLQMAAYIAEDDDRAFQLALNHAKKTGRMSEFQFIEARAVILNSTEKLVNTFKAFNDETTKNIFKDIEKVFREAVAKITIQTEVQTAPDNSTNNYEIVALDTKNIKILNDKITKLTQETVDKIVEQNKVLTEIKKILSDKTTISPQKMAPENISLNQITNGQEGRLNQVALTAKNHINDLFESSSLWS